jgi:hypothetical protein
MTAVGTVDSVTIGHARVRTAQKCSISSCQLADISRVVLALEAPQTGVDHLPDEPP